MDEHAGRAVAPWRTVNVVLLVLALLLGAATTFFAVRAADADAGPTDGSQATRHAVALAARDESLAFLTLDHRDMDPLVDAVLAGATGTFASQYAGARADLVRSTKRAQAVQRGTVRAVGVSELSAGRAVVLVAADAQVRNRSTKGAAEPRYYRLRLTLVEQRGRWLTSDLELVG